MPLDLELVQPSDKTSSEDVGEGFEEVFDDVFSEALSEKTAQVLPEGSWQQETESPPQSVAENVVSNREPSKFRKSYKSSRLEHVQSDVSNLYSDCVLGVCNIPIKPPKSSDARPNSESLNDSLDVLNLNRDFEEESMNESVDKEDNFECHNKTCDARPKSESLNDTVDVSNLSRDFGTGEYNTPPASASNEESTDEIVPQFLIDYFVSMGDPSPLTDIGTEIHHQCAFYFPAVVMTLGRKNWHQLKNAYQALASAVQWKVRCTLASSIHEIALILGEELSGSDLVPIYDGFIKDLDEVRIGALKHLNTFLRVLRPADRQQYLPKLSDFVVTDNEWNWRFREEFAGQLVKLVVLYKPEDVSEHIAPLALQLLQDKVAAVRQIAVSLVSLITNSNNFLIRTFLEAFGSLQYENYCR